jgi:RND family efflux transporter MFP subunit
VGALTQPGQELFRLIRGNRLEWRAEVTASELSRIAPGMSATLRLPGGGEVTGKVRTIAPTVDPQTRNAIVYVDLPATADSPARAGMFARGEFDLGRTPALTLPQTAVIQREGFAYAFRVGPDNRVSEVKIGIGRRVGDRVEVTQGLDESAQVVASGAGFLADGDLVRVVPATTAQR